MDFCTNCVNEYAWRPTDNPFPNCVNEYAWRPTDNPFPKECKECEVVNGKPSNFKPKNKTNADRIRAMSDGELAHWICKKMMSCSSNVCPGADLCQSGDGLANGLVKWLKQPVETENADRCVCCGAIIPEGQMVCPNCLVTVKEG